MKKPIRKAVLPVAGLGTRFLPATKAVPKEMLTVVDRPILQYVVDEAREAGIEHFIFVTGRNKGVIEDHFDSSYELEDTLKRRGKDGAYAALMADLPPAGATSFTRQQAPLGLGHAVWCARDIVGDEPFAVLLPDMVTKPGAARRPLPRPVRRGLQRIRRQHSRGRGSAARGDAPVRRRRGRRRSRPRLRDHRHGRKAAAGDVALEPDHFRTLHPAAGNFPDPGAGREGRGRRNPADRRHDPARPQAEIPRRAVRRRHLRLRLEARLPRRQHRLRAQPARPRPRGQG